MEEDRYLSPVPGHMVTRYGTSQTIGYSVSPDTRDEADRKRRLGPPAKTLSKGAIVMIPAAEFSRFRRQYDRAIREGSLELRSKAEFDAIREMEAGAAQETEAKAAKQAAKAAKEAAKADELKAKPAAKGAKK